MIQFITIAVLALAVFLAVRSLWRQHKRGKSSCGGSCAGCGGCSACRPEQES